MNYSTGNLLIKKALCHYPFAVALNHKKIIMFSRYSEIARRLQFKDLSIKSIKLHLTEEKKNLPSSSMGLIIFFSVYGTPSKRLQAYQLRNFQTKICMCNRKLKL